MKKNNTFKILSIIFIFILMIDSLKLQSQIPPTFMGTENEEEDLPYNHASGPDQSIMQDVLLSAENGWAMPVKGTIRILIVFAEKDCSPCGGSGCFPYPADWAWSPGQLPNNTIDANGNDVFKNTWFDQNLTSGQQPTAGNLTDYYYQMSMGQYIILGDYYPEIIKIPCNSTVSFDYAVMDAINAKTLINGAFSSKHGLTLADFDSWGNEGDGEVKTNIANNSIDGIVIVKRNTTVNSTSCSGGNGMSYLYNYTLNQNATQTYTVRLGSQFQSCDGGIGIFKAEYFHAMFGHNNWHSGGGDGSMSFLINPSNYSMTSYSIVGQLACAYDRHRMGWYGWKNNVDGTRKDFLISAKTTVQPEVNTDLDISTNFPDGTEFILRDFVTYGDAVRIKLPYLNWLVAGDVKNQYLWIENHQKISPLDKSAWEPSTCKESWSKGIYAYIQVGKDIKESTSADDLFGATHYGNIYPDKPNGLGSWLFPLTAEGNYDFKYRFDLFGSSSDNCVWDNNKYLPKEKSSLETKPNPFTGMSDLFEIVDFNNYGNLQTAGAYQPWTAEIINGQLQFTAYKAGDSKDAFKCDGSCPKKILSLATNPAPLPVYTYKSNGYSSTSGNTTWENRTIWLNGISIEILGENVDGNGAMKVKVRFDDYEVNNDVRWCGNIKLSPNYQNPNLSNYALNLMSGKTILIDKGKSPTQHKGIVDGSGNFIIGSDGRKIFTQPTTFTVLPNAFFHTEINSTVIVDNGSTLTLESGSKYEVNNGSILRIRSNSTLVIEQGSELKVNDGGKIIIESTAKLEYNGGSINLVGNNSVLEINGILKIASNITFNFTGSGEIYFKTPWIVDGSGNGINPIQSGTNSKIILNGASNSDVVLHLGAYALLWPQDNLAQFTITNAKILFDNASTISLGCRYIFNHVDFIQNGWGKLTLWRTSGSLINYCNFDGVNIEGNLSGCSSVLRIRNTTLKNIGDYALKTIGAGVQLMNVQFDNCVEAWHQEAMTLPSLFLNSSIIGSDMTGNGIWCQSSAASLSLINTNIIGLQYGYQTDGTTGIYAEGPFSLNLRCCKVQNFWYGLFAKGGCNLNMSVDLGNGYNDISGNNLPVKLDAAGSMNINNGFNWLAKPVNFHWEHSGGLDIEGTIITATPDEQPTNPIQVDQNQWYWNYSYNGIIGNPINKYDIKTSPTNYYGWSYPYTIVDASPHVLATCGSMDNPQIPSNSNMLRVCATCTNITTPHFNNIPYNEAVRIAISNMEIEDSTKNDLTAITMFNEILLSQVDLNDPSIKWLSKLAFEKMNIALTNAFANERIIAADNVSSFHPSVQEVLDIYAHFAATPTQNNYLEQFYLDYTKAQIFRLAGRYDLALTYFNNISNCYIGNEEIRQLNNAKIITNAEQLVTTGQVSQLQFTDMLKALTPPVIKQTIIDSTANVNTTVKLGENVKIGTNTTIEQGVIIGNNVTIGNNVSIKKETNVKEGTTIGNNTIIEKGNTIGADNIIGSNVTIKKECVLANNVTLSDNAGIDENSKIGGFVTIGLNTKLQKEAFIADGTSIGANGNFDKSIKIGSNVTILDNAIVKKEVQLSDRTFLGNNVTINQSAKIGSDVTINNSLTIGSNARISNNKTVTTNVANNAQVGTTTPAIPAIPGQVIFNCTFAQANAKLRGNLFNGFTATNENTSILNFATGSSITFKPAKLSLNCLWDFGDCTTSTEQTPAHTYTKPGVYVITLTETVKCTQIIYTGAITVYPAPYATFTNQQQPLCSASNKYVFNKSNNVGDLHTILYNCQTGLCSNDPTGLDTSLYRVKYHWNFGLVKPAFDETFTLKQIYKNLDSNIICTFPQSGDYPVSLSATLEVKNKLTNVWSTTDIIKTFTDTIHAGINISADFDFTQPVCYADSIHFTNKTQYGNKPFTYNWSFAFHAGSTLVNPVYKYSAEGTYNISLIATDALGCKDTVIKQIIIPVCPSIFGTIAESSDCGGNPVINDTLFVVDNAGISYNSIFAVTDNTGQFNFSSAMINTLDTNNLYSFRLMSGFGLTNTQFKTVSQWKNTSPLSLIVDHKQYWIKDFSMADSIHSISNIIDISRNIYVAGTAYYPNYKVDYLLIKYDPIGNELWHISYNPTGFGSYSLTDMKTDNGGNCILTGTGDDGTTIVKIDPSGNIVWNATWIDDNYFSDKAKLVIDSTDNIYITSGITDYNTGAAYTALTKYSTIGQKLWVSFNTTIENLYPQSIKSDKSGNIVILAKTGSDGIILKYNSTGTLLWQIANTNNLQDIATGIDNSIFATGTANNNANFITVKYNASGILQWSQFYNYPAFSGNNLAQKIVTDNSGNIIVAGTSQDASTSWPINPSVQIPHNRYSLVKYSPDGTELWNTSFSTGSPMGAIHYLYSMITDMYDNIYTAGQEFFSTIVSGRISKSHGQFLTVKFSPNGENLWYESLYNASDNSSSLADIISSENENIYVTGNSALNQVRTIKYVQCPSYGSNARVAHTSNSNSETDNTVTNDNSKATNDSEANNNRISMNNKNVEFVTMFPNPNDGNFYFNYSLPENEICRFAVLDQLGKKIFNVEIKSGRNTIFINSNDFSNGIYYYQVTAGKRLVKTEKLVITK